MEEEEDAEAEAEQLNLLRLVPTPNVVAGGADDILRAASVVKEDDAGVGLVCFTRLCVFG